MDDPFSGETSLPEVDLPEKGERMDAVRDHWWASLSLLLVFWVVFSLLLFPLIGFVTGALTLAIIAAPIVGLAAAGALGFKLGLVEPVDEARKTAPLWARLLIPIPIFVVLWLLFVVAIGPLIPNFVLMATVTTAAALAVTGAGVYTMGLWGGLVGTVQDSGPTARLAMLTVAGLLVGAAVFAGLVIGVGNIPLALATFVPVAVLAGVGLAIGSGWDEDAYEAVRSWHFGIRMAAFLVLEALLTVYVAVLIGGIITDARFAYAIGILAGLVLVLPASIWVRTYRDAWQTFGSLDEEYQILSVLPVFPIVALLVFGLIVVLTDSFVAGYIASIPIGIAALLGLGYLLGVTQDIPPVVRERNLPERSGIFLATFALLSAYAYFALALVIQNVEISLIGGMAFAGAVLAATSYAFDLDRGLGEEFESYGAPAEAAVLVSVFLVSLALVFLAIALTVGDFRLAFLVSVVAAAGLNYLIAHTTGLVDSMRTVLARVPWYGDLGILAAVFFAATLYGTLALGVFVDSLPISLIFGIVVGLGAVVGLSKDLELGEDVMESAEEDKPARATVLLLTFLGGFLVGLYASAAALSAAGTSIFGFPFFIALITGTGATVGLARYRGWDDQVLGRVRSRTDKAKVAVIVAVWLAIGVFTGFALTSLPVGADDLGIGSSPSLPLTVALGAGLLLWIWLPAVLFRTVEVQRSPADATLETRDQSRALASMGWGLLVFAIVLVSVLAIFGSPLIAVGSALAVGYLVALVISTRRRPDTEDT